MEASLSATRAAEIFFASLAPTSLRSSRLVAQEVRSNGTGGGETWCELKPALPSSAETSSVAELKLPSVLRECQTNTVEANLVIDERRNDYVVARRSVGGKAAQVLRKLPTHGVG